MKIASILSFRSNSLMIFGMTRRGGHYVSQTYEGAPMKASKSGNKTFRTSNVYALFSRFLLETLCKKL